MRLYVILKSVLSPWAPLGPNGAPWGPELEILPGPLKGPSVSRNDLRNHKTKPRKRASGRERASERASAKLVILIVRDATGADAT